MILSEMDRKIFKASIIILKWSLNVFKNFENYLRVVLAKSTKDKNINTVGKPVGHVYQTRS
jgi:hypothetical protein